MKNPSDLYIGVMSGTSLDGVDAVVLDFSSHPPNLLGSRFEPYPKAIVDACLSLNRAGAHELERSRLLARELASAYASAIERLLAELQLDPRRIAAIGCHGQTVRHRPELGFTIQLVDGALLVELTGIPVVVDFRARDIAAGGHGAPLVPAFHRMWFHSPDESRAIINIGGVANVTGLSPDGRVRGFDTGPGNGLMDEWVARQLGHRYDVDGAYASSGRIELELLESMLSDPYFQMEPPKSTGRDHFNDQWLAQFDPDRFAPADVQCTLAELTAVTIARAIGHWLGEVSSAFVCGGGVHNDYLMRRLAVRLGDATRTASTIDLGLHPDWVEASAFAWLARCCLRGEPANVPAVTGAAGARVLGAVYPA